MRAHSSADSSRAGRMTSPRTEKITSMSKTRTHSNSFAHRTYAKITGRSPYFLSVCVCLLLKKLLLLSCRNTSASNANNVKHICIYAHSHLKYMKSKARKILRTDGRCTRTRLLEFMSNAMNVSGRTYFLFVCIEFRKNYS